MFLRLTPKFGQPSYWNTDHFLTVHVTGLDTGSTTVEFIDRDAITFEETIRIGISGQPYVYDHAESERLKQKQQEQASARLAELDARRAKLSEYYKVYDEALDASKLTSTTTDNSASLIDRIKRATGL